MRTSSQGTTGAVAAPGARRGTLARGATRTWSTVLALTLGVGLLPTVLAAPATAAPVGQGFNLNASDLRFILKQIKIAERHADTRTADNPCGTLLGGAPDQIPAATGSELPWGLRTVDGTCNNLIAGQSKYGTAQQRFPRLVPKVLQNAESGDPDGPGPSGPTSTSYVQRSGAVFDSQPRIISNLVVDQTAGNPAAVDAAAATDDLEGAPVADARTGSFFIPNVAPDVGLSAPYNSWFTLFGQFFDHGLDLVKKGGNGTVFVPLQRDDPLFDDGADNVAGTGDDGPNFMVLTRATHGGDHEALNETSPFIDQSQTYSSHPSHQVFLRAYAADAAGKPQTTGALLTGPGGGMATWADVKAQAASLLGIALTDDDVLSVPLLATDPYGRFERGPNGYPQLVVGTGLREGNPDAPVSTAGATRSGHAFLDDIAHHAAPGTVDHDHNPVTPRVPRTPDALADTADDRDPMTYDDEMLAAHFMAGDGRVNENIGLISVHHVFHTEHNRLVAYLDALIADPSVTQAERDDWHATNRYTARDGGYGYGERLFQAARFVTEMEYQHLAFEEFARKVQPMINAFGEAGTGYNTSINPAIRAEFAHAVYRFGHSMLNESVDRVSATGVRSDIDLLDAFLNPPAFMAGGLTPEQAAGNIVRGMTRQIGNELDEFTTEALRNQLLGLPLDLATLNIARARETGTPGLNAARRAFYAESNNAALAPYQSWADFRFNLKNPRSLNNFVAAYGRHPSITEATTLAGKRAAADAIVYGVNGPDGDPGTADDIPSERVPEDRYAFLNSSVHERTDADGVTHPAHSTWVSGPAGVTTTGVDAIDLWVGGLAEKQLVFGGLLGPTFNYVFEGQMEDLQFGDRFYYLSRTAGLNLLTQLEGNSFAEIIHRTTDASGLPADSFSRPDLVFAMANLGTTGTPTNDPATPYNESTLLTRMADGTLRYGGAAHVVFNGTDRNDRMWASEGDDTLRGSDGDDWTQGGDGNDNHIGGLGDDILLDSGGDDVLKGGDGHDTLSSGQGFGGDLNQSGRGNDFVVHGNDLAETFAGPGDDYVTGGAGDDTIFGDDGDDWIESGATVTGTGGGAFNLLQGDNGAPFQDDLNEAGHDVLVGYGGESDYDAEGGDDVMLLGPGIQRSEGMLGFDFSTHDSDTAAADSDMGFTGLLPPSVATNRDRFDLVEALSGWNQNDVLRGDDRNASAMEGHELTASGIARISGLAALLPAGATGFTGGNLLLGGGGSDLIEGRGGDDLIDGDGQLNVRISVRDRVEEPTVQVESFERMRDVQARVLSGAINPGRLRIVREIQIPSNGTSVDTAVFSGPREDYDVTFGPESVTVAHTRGTLTDGTDTLRRVERLQFADGTVGAGGAVVTAPSAPEIGAATAGDGSATVTWTAPADGGSPITGYSVRVVNGTTQVGTLRPAAADATSLVVTGLANGTAYRFQVQATNAEGTGSFSALSNTVTPATVVTPPAAPTIGTATPGDASATVTWTAPADDGGSPVTGYSVRVVDAGNSQVGLLRPAAADARSLVVTGLTNGNAYRFHVQATNAVGAGSFSALSTAVRPSAATPPAAPAIGTATAGNGQATVTWTAPADGGSAITGYAVRVVDAAGAQVGALRPAPADARSLTVTGLANDTSYRLQVQATNAVGTGAFSALSNAVTPTAPTLGAPTVTSRTPGIDATGASTTNNVTVRFSEPVQGVNGSTFTLVNSATGQAVPATVFYNASTNGAGLDPSAALVAGTRYTVTLSGGPLLIRDTGGTPLATTSWSFTTAGTAPSGAPTVTGRAPAAGATGQAVGTSVTATFSEAVQGVTTGTFVLRAAGSTTDVPAAVRQGTSAAQWILDPTADLAAGVTYTATLDGGTTTIRDLTGVALADTSWSFTTSAAPAPGGAPTVTARTPGSGFTNQSVGTSVTATFSEAVVGVSTTTFVLRAPGSTTNLAATATRNGTTNQWILDPTANLLPDTRYTVTLTGGTGAIRDTTDVALTTTSWSFLTGPAPTVTGRTPAAGATGVSRTANVTATFSEAVQGVGTSTFVLRPSGSTTAVAATVTRNGTTNQWILDPGVTLAASTEYTATLTGGTAAVRDLAGNPTASTSWRFTTGP